MGTTLTNGVYLPNEGERNCYAGLKTNWEILDQKVADVTALQQAVAGALHREIVESLPTTDIDPNTIYMILSGTSATENVYNEFMYVNNAWELIGTSATDLTNYYTKSEVDGKLLLKAGASDLTSHTGDTTIHVTANDKTKWNTVALIKQLRLVNTQVGSATTIAFVNIDDTNGIKVGDKCMDLDGKMFEITAVDTTNQTVTIGSALIDLALDGNVAHKTGDETIAGAKTFSDNLLIYNSDNSVDAPRLNIKTSKYVKGDTTNTDTMRINFLDASGNSVASIYANKNTSGTQYLSFQVYTTDNNNANITSTINYYISKNGDKYFLPYEDNQISLGGTVRRWKSVYATNYYYGSDNVEFSTKFVTTDTQQAISGIKTFSNNLIVANTDTTANIPNLNLRNYNAERGTTDSTVQTIQFSDKNSKALSLIESRTISNGNTATNILCYNNDANNATVSGGVAIIKSQTETNFAPSTDNAVTCGRPLARWSRVYGTEYYYGSGNVEFSNKFVTTDSTQTISGAKTFSSNINVYNSDSTTDTANIVLKNSKAERGSTTDIGEQNISFVDKNNNQLGNIKCINNSSGVTNMYITCNASGNDIGVRLSRSPSTTYFRSTINNDCKLGTADVRWSDVQTYKVNGLTPSSLSLPDIDNRIDISSYITDLTGVNNEYTPTVNGWICVRSGNATKISILDSGTNVGNNSLSSTATYLTVMTPCIANKKVYINVVCTSLSFAVFIPCLGNI